jgi:hypothetical protein
VQPRAALRSRFAAKSETMQHGAPDDRHADEEASAPPASSRLRWTVTAVVGARLGAMLADRPKRASDA